MSVNSKICCACKTPKPLGAFQRNAARKDGLQSRCRDCIKIRGAAYYLTHKEKVSTTGKKWRDANKEVVREQHLSRYLTIGRRATVLLASAKRRAADRGLDITISHQWLVSRWQEIGGLCEVTGLPMTLLRSPETAHRQSFNPSLDRRDNSKGYSEENTRFVCVIVNIAINDFGEADFTTMCKAVAARG
jgi:hypothetical protein